MLSFNQKVGTLTLETAAGPRTLYVERGSFAPDGSESQPVQPLCGVDGVLLELTRKIDEWSVLRREVGSEEEVYETTDVAPDLYEVAKDPAHLAERVLPLVNGRRTV